MIVNDIINQAKVERAKKKEVKRKQWFVTGNTNIYSRILNNEKSMELLVDYNDLALGLAMLNTEKYANTKESAAKKVGEAANTAKNESAKISKETDKQNEMLPGFQE